VLPRIDAVATLTREPFDVLVIGGGITGAGVALDAATRGYSVALIERGDYSSGTSSRSSKLVHGGLRYLQNFDLGLVREALLERQINVNLAPYLTKPLPLIVPAFEGQRLDRVVGLGLNAYDVMSVDRIRRRRRRGADESDWSPARHRIVAGSEVSELLPALADRSPTSGYLFYDCQTDDSRLVLTVLAEAERFGVVAANRLEALELLLDGGRAMGARVRDTESGEELEIRATTVVNATGVWADRLRPSELYDEAEVPVIRPSRGTHIIVDSGRLPMSAGAIIPAGSGRTIFVLPWLGQTLIGTTDTDHPERDVVHVRPAEEDITYLLDAVNEFFATALELDDLAGAYAGVRPLISTGDRGKSVDISRKAELYETSSGMITITGGKLTTWRRMAKQTVDRIVERDGNDARCITHELPLGMAVDPEDLTAAPEWAREQLAGRYGHIAHEVLASGPAERIVPDRPDLLAEVVYAVRREQARTVGDVLLRRTRLGLTAARSLTGAVIGRVAGAMGDELGWDEARRAREVGAFADEAREEGILPAP
jgi:glycerol-3-phosphate dehydrogenase